MLEMIDDGKIKIELNNEKQERHILNTKAYYNKNIILLYCQVILHWILKRLKKN